MVVQVIKGWASDPARLRQEYIDPYGEMTFTDSSPDPHCTVTIGRRVGSASGFKQSSPSADGVSDGS